MHKSYRFKFYIHFCFPRTVEMKGICVKSASLYREKNKRNGKLFRKNFTNKISLKIDERSSILTKRKKAQVQKTNLFLVNLSELVFLAKSVHQFPILKFKLL